MVNIYLVRHGETIWNRSGHYQGVTDVALNERGIEQAKMCALALSDVPFEKIISSDLQRARITAEEIASYHKNTPFALDSRLQEIDFGAWEGLTYEEISDRWPGYIEKMYEDATNVHIEGGESFVDVQKRAWSAIEDAIVDVKDGGNLLVVCHGGVIRTLICKAIGVNLKHAWNFRQGNTAINIIEYHGNGPFNTIQLLNDTAHTASIEGEDICG